MPMKNGLLRLPGLVIRASTIDQAYVVDGKIRVRTARGSSLTVPLPPEGPDALLDEIYSAMSGDAVEPEPVDPKTVREGRPESLYLGPNEFIFVPAPRPPSPESRRALVRKRILDEARNNPKLQFLYVSCGQSPMSVIQDFADDARAMDVGFLTRCAPGNGWSTFHIGSVGCDGRTVRAISPLSTDVPLGIRVDCVIFDGWAQHAMETSTCDLNSLIRWRNEVLARLVDGGKTIDIP